MQSPTIDRVLFNELVKSWTVLGAMGVYGDIVAPAVQVSGARARARARMTVSVQEDAVGTMLRLMVGEKLRRGAPGWWDASQVKEVAVGAVSHLLAHKRLAESFVAAGGVTLLLSVAGPQPGPFLQARVARPGARAVTCGAVARGAVSAQPRVVHVGV